VSRARSSRRPCANRRDCQRGRAAPLWSQQKRGEDTECAEQPASRPSSPPPAALIVAAGAALAEPDKRVAIHVDENDPWRMNIALNNVLNIKKYYEEKGMTVAVEVVAYGPGLHMFRADTSPVADRIERMALMFDDLAFSACGNTHAAMSAKAGHDVALLEEVEITPSGAVRLIELQDEGWAYLRP
jgi:intracellular sulfur oxidation DsrE/DsrF family protein